MKFIKYIQIKLSDEHLCFMEQRVTLEKRNINHNGFRDSHGDKNTLGIRCHVAVGRNIGMVKLNRHFVIDIYPRDLETVFRIGNTRIKKPSCLYA